MCEGYRCEAEGHGHHPGHVAHERCHCSCGHNGRKFLSRNEKIEMLKEYKKSLQNELEGVEEKLNSLKGEP